MKVIESIWDAGPNELLMVSEAALNTLPTASKNSPYADDPLRGAANLLSHCVGLRNGDSMLLVTEPAGSRYYEPEVARCIADAARRMGADVSFFEAGPAGGPESAPAELLDAIERVDHTLFLSRIGDQLRFAALPGPGTKSMTYTLGIRHLAGGFAGARHDVMEEMRGRIMSLIAGSRRYTISCPRGTQLEMRIDGDELAALRSASGFTVRNFPVMIIPPIPASGLSGRLVISHALTSTGIHEYEDSVVPLPSPVTLTLEAGKIVKIEGEPKLVARVEAQVERIDRRFGGEGRRLGSWHAGINPFTFFERRALEDIDRWNGVAFGSPRYAHFHLCGALPGDICAQVFDPTIRFDDETLWQDGTLAALNTAPLDGLLKQLEVPPEMLWMRQDIGVPL